jgi:hypothetical protein
MSDEDPKPSIMFWIWASKAVGMMRESGMNDTRIACVLCDVRAAAIHEERQRVELLAQRNPPQAGIRWSVMESEMHAHCEGRADGPEVCPVCGGDCAGANPPVVSCPMRDGRADG